MKTEVVVVGCGAIGLSIAYHIAAAGMKVTALDRVGPGAQTSARAAGLSVIAQTDAAMGELMHRSISAIINFEARTGIPLPHSQVGSIKYALSEWSACQLDREVSRARKLGADVSMVSCQDAERIAPHTDGSAARAAWHAPNDIYFSPGDLTGSLYRAGEKAGAQYRFGEDVTGIVVENEHARGVVSNGEVIEAERIILASGPWTAHLLSALGISLPLINVRHLYSIRSGIPNIHPGLPTVRVVDYATYARPEGSNLMFGTYEPSPMRFDAVTARTEDVSLDPVAIEAAVDHVAALYRGLRGSKTVELRGGLTTITPDGSYLIDEALGAQGLYFVTGCNVMGLSVSPALGEEFSSWVRTGSRSPLMRSFSVDRFTEPLSAEAMERRALAEYEGIYRDPESAHNIRTYGNLGNIG